MSIEVSTFNKGLLKDVEQFVIDSLLHYKLDPSRCGIDPVENVCRYLTEDGKKCALGQHLREDKAWLLFNGDARELFSYYDMNSVLTEEALVINEKLRMLGVDIERFWLNVQAYHDNVALLDKDLAYPVNDDKSDNAERIENLFTPVGGINLEILK